MERDNVYNNFWINEEDLNFFKEWYDEKIEIIKELMRESGCLIYPDYSMVGLTGGLPITYVAKPEDLYTEEELLLERFKNYEPTCKPMVHVELTHYNKYLKQ